MGTQLPSPKGAQPPIFGHCPLWSNGWTKIPLVYGGRPRLRRLFVQWGPSYLQKGHTHITPFFCPWLLRPNGWMDENTTWHGSRPRHRSHCIRRGPSCPRKGHSSPPSFRPCILWPLSPISATAELLLQSLAPDIASFDRTVTFDVKRRSLTLFPEIVFNGQTVADRTI